MHSIGQSKLCTYSSYKYIKFKFKLKKMIVRKLCYVFLMAMWVILSLYYYYDTIYGTIKQTLKENLSENGNKLLDIDIPVKFSGTEDFLINTPGCYIPNYTKSLRFKEARIMKKSCGQRAVFVEKISEKYISIIIDDVKMKQYNKGNSSYQCCYRFVSPDIVQGNKDSRKIRYSSCELIKKPTNIELQEEIIVIKCETPKKEIIYEDAYVFVKKLKVQENRDKFNQDTPWNILILGMDTMSRARLIRSMPKTAKYLRNNHWLDFRGYQKVGYNTFPNVMALLTGRNTSDVHKECRYGMDKCNDIMIWNHFKKAGYYTASGEDYLSLPDTFTRYNGFKTAPTDHYLRPFFLTGEHLVGNFVCAQKKPSAKHLLDYALDFSKSYKHDGFFGMFWFNSFSHNLQNVPALIDEDVVNFFDVLHKSGVLNNTFVLFLSDHGIRYGEMRIPYESYYEERLPMLYIWVPFEFRKIYKMYKNLLINQSRLITPYDLYATMLSILEISKRNESLVPQRHASIGCPNCISIFNEFSPHRTCKDVNVNEKWCTCHSMVKVQHGDIGIGGAIQSAMENIHNTIKKIGTHKCMQCDDLQLKRVLRAHKYKKSSNATVYILAFEMSPGDVSYEASIEQNGDIFNVLDTTQTISVYNTRGNCVRNPVDRAYCVCKRQTKC